MIKAGFFGARCFIATFILLQNAVFAQENHTAIIIREDVDRNRCAFDFTSQRAGPRTQGEFCFSWNRKLQTDRGSGQMGLLDFGTFREWFNIVIPPSESFKTWVRPREGRTFLVRARHGNENEYIMFDIRRPPILDSTQISRLFNQTSAPYLIGSFRNLTLEQFNDQIGRWYSLQKDLGLEYWILGTGTIRVHAKTKCKFELFLGTGSFKDSTDDKGCWVKERALEGTYTIRYDEVENCSPPQSEIKTLHKGENIIFDNDYYDLLTGTISVRGDKRRSFGFSIRDQKGSVIKDITDKQGNWDHRGLPLGTYTIQYQSIPWFIRPKDETKELSGKGITFHASYVSYWYFIVGGGLLAVLTAILAILGILQDILKHVAEIIKLIIKLITSSFKRKEISSSS